MCVHMYVRTYVCAYICMCVHMYVRTYVCAYICMCVHMYVRTYVCAYICMCVHMYVRTYIHTVILSTTRILSPHLYTPSPPPPPTHTHTHTHTPSQPPPLTYCCVIGRSPSNKGCRLPRPRPGCSLQCMCVENSCKKNTVSTNQTQRWQCRSHLSSSVSPNSLRPWRW